MGGRAGLDGLTLPLSPRVVLQALAVVDERDGPQAQRSVLRQGRQRQCQRAGSVSGSSRTWAAGGCPLCAAAAAAGGGVCPRPRDTRKCIASPLLVAAGCLPVACTLALEAAASPRRVSVLLRRCRDAGAVRPPGKTQSGGGRDCHQNAQLQLLEAGAVCGA